MPSVRRPCAFLDRDGTLNLDSGYTHKPEDLAWTPGAREAIRLLNERGHLVIVCTNQSGIGRGYFDEPAMQAFHDAMVRDLGQAGAWIDAFYFCPHIEDHHPDRKPNPGMLTRAMADWPVDPTRSFMIGDRAADLQAAAAAGVAGYAYASGSLLEVVLRALAETGG